MNNSLFTNIYTNRYIQVFTKLLGIFLETRKLTSQGLGYMKLWWVASHVTVSSYFLAVRWTRSSGTMYCCLLLTPSRFISIRNTFRLVSSSSLLKRVIKSLILGRCLPRRLLILWFQLSTGLLFRLRWFYRFHIWPNS